MDGIVIVDKPQGWTSQDVVSKLRGVFHTRRIGHGGTLDPMATGVLPVFVGKATKAVSFFESAEKVYETVLRLGIDTDTEDITGTVLSEKEVSVTREQAEAVLKQFRGEIFQVPPMYSAIKVGGQKLYELARKGKTVERQGRKITVFSLDFLGMEGRDVRLRVHCSKGTYIRTLCKDIGQALGCGGCMAQLRRVQAGQYEIAQAVPLETLIKDAKAERFLLPLDSFFAFAEPIYLNEKQTRLCRNGNRFSADVQDGQYRVYGADGEFLMLGKAEKGVLYSVKNFFGGE